MLLVKFVLATDGLWIKAWVVSTATRPTAVINLDRVFIL